MIRYLLFLAAVCGIARAEIDLRLPTENHHLFSDEPERFYMYVDRIFEGESSKPWEGGAYGFTRTARRIGGQVILTKFHEGIDISPVNRDRAGNPLDLVSSIADGRVAYVSAVSGRSNYGKYVVVRHEWEGSFIYSLYAHMAEITCQPGNPVVAGSVLGRMGYTGVGLNRTRAHLHLEVAMMTSSRYEDWHRANGGGINHHGVYNGMNLIGVDVAQFFLDHRKNPKLRFSDFVSSTQVYFKVAVPAKGVPDFVTRHPWICRGNPADAVSWEIAFSATGQPVSFTPSERRVNAPVVTAVRPSEISHGYRTRNLLSGVQNRASLTRGGKSLVTLVSGDFPGAGEQAMEPADRIPEG